MNLLNKRRKVDGRFSKRQKADLTKANPSMARKYRKLRNVAREVIDVLEEEQSGKNFRKGNLTVS